MTTMTAVAFDDHDIAILPNGTVTLTRGPGAGEMHVYSEVTPDPMDWDLAWTTAGNGRITGAWAEGAVDVYRVTLP
jgi:hypothetical protein